MDRAEWIEWILNSSIAVICTGLHFLFGGWNLHLQILVAMVSFDIFTGILASGKARKTNSRVCKKGLKSKVGIFVLVAVATLIDKLMGTPYLVQTATIYWYVSNEGISIAENLGKLNVPLPAPLKKALEQLKESKSSGLEGSEGK